MGLRGLVSLLPRSGHDDDDDDDDDDDEKSNRIGIKVHTSGPDGLLNKLILYTIRHTNELGI